MLTGKKYLFKCDLVERGWTKQMIETYYRNPIKKTIQKGAINSISLYNKEIVISIEKTRAFTETFTSTLDQRAAQIVKNRHNFLDPFVHNHAIGIQATMIRAFQYAAHTAIKINNFDIDHILSKSLHNVDEDLALKLIAREEPGFLLIVVDYIRDHESTFTQEMNKFITINEIADSYGMNFENFNLCRHALKQTANLAIANMYPYLAKECGRQNSLLFNWHPRRDAYRNIRFNRAA